MAANALQIQNAKHFRELLGNYSRWGFHHPGPGFFYIFALGEAIFHDVLHLVPAEMNAHILTVILLNTAFLFGAISLLANRCRSRLFVPAAILLAVFFIHVVNRTIPGSAILSIWMPHVLLFSFLYFATVCGAVALGEISKLPWLAFSGLLLLHGHAAQPLFVGSLTVLSLATLWFTHVRQLRLRSFLFEYRRPIAASLLLCAIFALPIVVDVVTHHPNNIQAIMRYNAQHRGLQHTLGDALRYEGSYLAFVTNNEVPVHLVLSGGSKTYISIYWWFCWFLLGLLVGVYSRRKQPINPLYKYLAIQLAVILVVFVIWSLKMGGGMFNFNGYFIYGMQLLALWLIAGVILDCCDITVPPLVAVVLSVLTPLSMFADRKAFTNQSTGDPESVRLYESIPENAGPLHLSFPGGEDWLYMVGVANRMKHEGRTFCVDQMWGWTFGEGNVCREMDHLTNLVLTYKPRKCNQPCRALFSDSRFYLYLVPYPWFKLPLSIKPDNILTLNTDFNGYSEEAVWSTRKSTVNFRLAADFTTASQVRLTIFGNAIPARPAQVWLNSHSLGEMVAGPSSYDFLVDRSMLLPAAVNQLVIEVPKAGSPPNDPRTIGFLWGGLKLEAANP